MRRRRTPPAAPGTGPACRSGAAGVSAPACAYFLPQHSAVPAATSLLSTPESGLAAISVTPVSLYPLGFLPLLASSTPASTPIAAIFSGYCWLVAAITPAPTFLTPSQPPSTLTITTFFSLPAFFSALYAPAAAGSLIV